jgi:hypothetical protein
VSGSRCRVRAARLIGVSGGGELREQLRDGEERDAAMLVEHEQVFVAGNDGVRVGGERAGDDVIVAGDIERAVPRDDTCRLGRQLHQRVLVIETRKGMSW